MSSQDFEPDGAVGDARGKNQSRYGDDATPESTQDDNQWRARMLLGPPRSKNTPGYSAEKSSTRRKNYAEGGLVTDDDDEVPGGGDGQSDGQTSDHMDQLQQRINAAISTVDNALSYGRKLHGLGGGEQDMAAAMPAVPGNPYGQQREQPMPGPLPPTSNPFGKRTAAAMPAVPGNPYGQQREQPMPGPLPPTSNPFGKRVASSDGDDDGTNPGDEQEAA